MIKLMKYLKKSAGYVVLIIALLFLQAYCDLSLPDYTSKIVNVGIQQSGIEDSVPDPLVSLRTSCGILLPVRLYTAAYYFVLITNSPSFTSSTSVSP